MTNKHFFIAIFALLSLAAIIITGLAIIASQPRTLEACLLEHLKGANTAYAARAIEETCGNLFPKTSIVSIEPDAKER